MPKFDIFLFNNNAQPTLWVPAAELGALAVLSALDTAPGFQSSLGLWSRGAGSGGFPQPNSIGSRRPQAVWQQVLVEVGKGKGQGFCPSTFCISFAFLVMGLKAGTHSPTHP